VLVAVGAAIFVDMANRLGGNDGAVRVVAYVVSGIGFLGAGVIMREGSVRGLNTAATLWASAAVGRLCREPTCWWSPCWARCSCWPPTPCCARWPTASTASR
jgi:hypothetical protein